MTECQAGRAGVCQDVGAGEDRPLQGRGRGQAGGWCAKGRIVPGLAVAGRCPVGGPPVLRAGGSQRWEGEGVRGGGQHFFSRNKGYVPSVGFFLLLMVSYGLSQGVTICSSLFQYVSIILSCYTRFRGCGGGWGCMGLRVVWQRCVPVSIVLGMQCGDGHRWAPVETAA